VGGHDGVCEEGGARGVEAGALDAVELGGGGVEPVGVRDLNVAVAAAREGLREAPVACRVKP
jgi:hypothetical protein